MCRDPRISVTGLFLYTFIGVLFLACPLFAQVDAVFSSDELEEVKPDVARPSYEFLYRVQTDSILRFYKIRMNTTLYGDKRAFLWPKAIPAAKRPKALLYGSSEILFNDMLVLADADALFWKSDTGMVPLPKVPSPGIVLVRSDSGAVFQSLDRNGLALEQPLPAMMYTWADSAKPCIIRASGRISYEYVPNTAPGTYRIDDVNLEVIPRLPLLPHFLYPELDQAESDSASLLKVEHALAELKDGLRSDSAQIAQYLQGLHSLMKPVHDLQGGEDSTDLRARIHAREVEGMDLAKGAYSYNEFSERLLPVRDRIHELELLQAKIQDEIRRNGSPEAVWMLRHFYRYAFVVAEGDLGRNLPEWTANPGPAGLWGVGGSLRMPFPVVGGWGFELAVSGHYSQWQYHQGVAAKSSEVRAFAEGGFTGPLACAPSRNVALLLNVGPSFDWRSIRVLSDHGRESQYGFATSVHLGLDVLFTKLPVMVKAQYRFGSDRLGNLSLGIGMPLIFWRRLS